MLVVTKDDYNSCNTKNPIQTLNDGNSVFKFDRSGPFFFITGNADNCKNGQKLIIVVMALRPGQGQSQPPPPPPQSGTTPSPSPVASPPVAPSVAESPATPAEPGTVPGSGSGSGRPVFDVFVLFTALIMGVFVGMF